MAELVIDTYKGHQPQTWKPGSLALEALDLPVLPVLPEASWLYGNFSHMYGVRSTCNLSGIRLFPFDISISLSLPLALPFSFSLIPLTDRALC
jgi:hypothetical protein